MYLGAGPRGPGNSTAARTWSRAGRREIRALVPLLTSVLERRSGLGRGPLDVEGLVGRGCWGAVDRTFMMRSAARCESRESEGRVVKDLAAHLHSPCRGRAGRTLLALWGLVPVAEALSVPLSLEADAGVSNRRLRALWGAAGAAKQSRGGKTC